MDEADKTWDSCRVKLLQCKQFQVRKKGPLVVWSIYTVYTFTQMYAVNFMQHNTFSCHTTL
jgi:hypothetical protein